MRRYIIIILLLLTTFITADLTDHTSYNETSNICSANNGDFEISIYPCKVQDLDGKDITQYVDFKWNGNESKDLNYLFAYENNLTSYNMFFWYENFNNASYYGNETLYNIISIIQSNNSAQYGDLYDPEHVYEIYFSINDPVFPDTIYSYAFWGADNYTQLDSTTYLFEWNYTILEDDSAWVFMPDVPYYIGSNLTENGLEFYEVFDKEFYSGETLKTKWVYTPFDTEGKWYIFGKNSNISIEEAVSINEYVYSDPWYNENWLYKKEITISGTNIDADLTNFQTLVVLNSTNFNYAHAQANGEDLRFLDSTETTELDFSIELWNTSGNSYIWVEVPFIDDTTPSPFFLYYGNPEATDGQDITGTWSNRYAVWHINEAGTGTRYDRTSGNHDCTTVNYEGDEKANGMINGADDLDNVNDYMNCGAGTSLTNTPPYTVETWLYTGEFDSPDVILNKYQGGSWNGFMMYGKYDGDYKLCLWHICAGAGGCLVAFAGDDGVGSNNCLDINSNSWYLISTVVNDSGMHVYYNGTYVATASWEMGEETMCNSTSSWPFMIGSYQTYLYTFNGIIDETRLTEGSLTPAWIKATYYSETNNMLSVGAEQMSGVPPVIVFNSPPNDNWIYTNWALINYTVYEPNSQDFNTTLYGNNFTPPTTVLMQNDTLNGSLTYDILYNWTDLNETIGGFFPPFTNTYYHKLYAVDENGSSSTSSTYHFWVDLYDPTINFTSPTTETGAYSQNWIYVNATENDTNLMQGNIYLYFGNGTLFQQLIMMSSPYTYNFTNITDGTYYLNATVYDYSGRSGNTETRNITLLTQPPDIFINLLEKDITWIKWNWSISTGEIINITLYETETWTIIEQLTNMSLTEYTFADLHSYTEYTLEIWAKDILNNTGFAQSNITTEKSGLPQGIGGGGATAHNSLYLMIFFIICVLIMVYLFNRG